MSEMAKSQKAAYSSRVEELNRSNAKLEKDQQELRTELKDNAAARAKINRVVDGLEAKNKSLGEDLEEIETENQELAEAIKKIESENMELLETKKLAADEKKVLTEKLTMLGKTNEDLKAKFALEEKESKAAMTKMVEVQKLSLIHI